MTNVITITNTVTNVLTAIPEEMVNNNYIITYGVVGFIVGISIYQFLAGYYK